MKIFLRKVIPPKIFLFLQPMYHFFLAFFAALFYGFPSRKLFIVGVTGTKGKTTVVELLHEIFKEAGYRTASASSLRFKTGDKEARNGLKMTMPGRMFLQKFLHEAVKDRCSYAIVEVTSEGIKQFRHRFINFDAAVVTNIAPEHIEAHGGFEKYLRAKLDLFWRLKKDSAAVINADDAFAGRFSAATSAHKVFYGHKGIGAGDRNIAVHNLSLEPDGTSFDLGKQHFSTRLAGEFNFYNVLAAIAVADSRHISHEKIARAIEAIGGVEGRMEFIQRKPLTAVVDYAHTPDSLRAVYGTLKKSTAGKMICVLGAAGGGRDVWKRPVLGSIAAQFCEEVIITDEDPYDEDPQRIIDEVEEGFSQNAGGARTAKKILDRKEAIKEALALARPGDTVVITGKGAEPVMMGPGGSRISWDDREVAREALRNL